MKRLRIVFLRSNPVDPDPRVEKEANALLKAGHSVIVVAWDRGKTYPASEGILELKNGTASVIRVGIAAEFGGGMKKNAGPLLRFQIFLYGWLMQNRDKYDVIHACDFDTAFTASKVARHCGKRLVYDIFDYYVDSFNIPGSLKDIIERCDHKIINGADAVIICTEQRKKQIAGTEPRSLTVIHNSPEKTLRYELPTTGNTVRVVYVGMLQEIRLLKEIAEAVSERSDCELHIGGFGILEDYFEEMSRRHDNIKYYGRLKYAAALELERKCDIMCAVYDPVIKNHYYAAPNKFYEALMLGKPIIMANGTGMSDVVRDYDIGECIEYVKESFNVALDRLIARRSEWNEMSQRMKKLYNDRYSWETMERRLLELYEKF